MIGTAVEGGGPILAKTIDLVARSKTSPPSAIKQKRNTRPGPTIPCRLIRWPPASVHIEYSDGRMG